MEELRKHAWHFAVFHTSAFMKNTHRKTGDGLCIPHPLILFTFCIKIEDKKSYA